MEGNFGFLRGLPQGVQAVLGHGAELFELVHVAVDHGALHDLEIRRQLGRAGFDPPGVGVELLVALVKGGESDGVFGHGVLLRDEFDAAVVFAGLFLELRRAVGGCEDLMED